MTPLMIITAIAGFLLIGVLLSVFAKKIKVPDIFFLILFGVLIGALKVGGQPLFTFPPGFLESVGILALAMIVFDSTVKVKIKLIDSLSNVTLRLVWIVLLANLALFSIVTFYFFNIDFGSALLFSSIMIGTSPAVILPILESSKNRVFEIIKLESLLNTPLTVLLPFLILDFTNSVKDFSITSVFFQQLTPFLTKFVAGLGSGLLIGIVLFKVLKKAYSKIYSPMAVVIAALLAYVLAENLGGNGVLAVTTLGLFFGNIALKHPDELLEVESLLAKSLYILLFVLLGSMIQISFTYEFLIMSVALFAAYLLVRYIAVTLAFKDLEQKQKWMMTLLCSKGIAVSVVAFSLASLASVPTIILDLTLVFILYSIIVSSIASWYSKQIMA